MIRLQLMLLAALVLAACSRAPSFGPLATEAFGDESAMTQAVSFRSDGFKIVGDLRLPTEG